MSARQSGAGAGRRVEIPATTLCCIDCRDYELAADALTRCLERCRFERALFFTDASLRVDGAQTVLIERISSLQALQDPEVIPADPEDLAICRSYRALLEEKHGIRFAPEEVAAAFSFETVPSDGPTFGFHGLGHLVNMFDMGDAQIAAYRPPQLEVRPR